MEMQAQAAQDAEAMANRQNQRELEDGFNAGWHASHRMEWQREEDVARGMRLALDATHKAKMKSSASYRREHELATGFAAGK